MYEQAPYTRLVVIDINSGAVRVLDPKSQGIFAGEVLYADPTGAGRKDSTRNFDSAKDLQDWLGHIDAFLAK
jgi:hypothetical protein